MLQRKNEELIEEKSNWVSAKGCSFLRVVIVAVCSFFFIFNFSTYN